MESPHGVHGRVHPRDRQRVLVPGGVGAGEARSSDGNQSAAALDEENGGLDLTSKEAPAFGDPEVEALPVMVEAPGATPKPPPVPKTTTADTAAPVAAGYDVMVVWGHLPPAHDASGTDATSRRRPPNGPARSASPRGR